MNYLRNKGSELLVLCSSKLSGTIEKESIRHIGMKIYFKINHTEKNLLHSYPAQVSWQICTEEQGF